ncbi:Ribonuclease I precursor [Pseudoruegeria aquimaris]|uniref:Ribonuclease I n=1 Tax=Pseudoruegeria aquimaris TaxID=393663 RepID=A0A1Y5SFZ5_9RHOB|nr:ribonuclease T2 [Pseudoruegeria aquimaris]SLN36811.1 Ribonuclease I precursor [Pseudoruegeria aquimaris]
MRVIVAALVALGLAGPLAAEGERAGDFDYYVLALSWSPNWCKLEGRAKGSPQCGGDARFGWVMHGLWPQYERGWPSYCRTPHREATRGETAAMADVMGSAGSAWHQWKKHGRCSGLAAPDYFAQARAAFESIARPEILRQLDRPVRLPATVVEEAFLEANPALFPDAITLTCRDGHIQEARICLTKDLEVRRCGADVIRDCTAKAVLEPID